MSFLIPLHYLEFSSAMRPFAKPKIEMSNFYCFGFLFFAEASRALIRRDHVSWLADINSRIIGATSQYRLAELARTITRKDTTIKIEKAVSAIAACTNAVLLKIPCGILENRVRRVDTLFTKPTIPLHMRGTPRPIGPCRGIKKISAKTMMYRKFDKV